MRSVFFCNHVALALKTSNLLFVYFLIVSLVITFPCANAAPTSMIKILQVGSGVAGGQEPIPVTIAVTYNGTSSGDQLLIGIFNAETSPQTLVPGIITSSTQTCMSTGPALALCRTTTYALSGAVRVSFQIGGIFGDARRPGNWKLNATATLVDSNNTLIPDSATSSLFTVTLTPVILQINAPSVVPITVNGMQEAPGPASVGVALGDNNVSAPAFVQMNATMRLRFDHWSDGYGQANRTVTVTGNATYEADYVTQYRLTITGAEENITGPGWFDSGTNASFSIYPYETVSSILGALGAKQTFQGFYENDQLLTSQSSGTIIMDAPHTLNVVWQIDYTTPAIILIGIILVISLGALVLRRRTTRRASTRRRRTARRSQKPLKSRKPKRK